MPTTTPHPAEFRSVKQLINRMSVNRTTERNRLISVEDGDVPNWQRGVVWAEEDMGLLAYSILSNYPIGLVILWRKSDGIRVPIDGRQRLTAIRRFADGLFAIPPLRHIPSELHNKKYKLREGDVENGFSLLDLPERERFDDYELSIVEYQEIDERTAMDIFVKLQGGKSLTKTEVRAALGGRLCDYVTELTSAPVVVDADEEEEEETQEVVQGHAFFREVNLRNTRKSHRNICDVLLHEFLYPGLDKHWSSLETMYLDKSTTLTEDEKNRFRTALNKFYRAVQIERGGEKKVLPQLKSAFLILTYFRAWQELSSLYAIGTDFDFVGLVQGFERERLNETTKEEVPWVNFNAALSNAGYAQNRLMQRHQILMSYILRNRQALAARDARRAFTEEEKIAIWDRASGRCEFCDEAGIRCAEVFANFRAADADHIVRWVDGGPTSLDNGRLLCQPHNRGRPV